MRIVSVVMMFCVVCIAAHAQQVPNSDFEEWTLSAGSGQYKDYEEPSNGWASGNGAIHIAAGADPVCEKSTDARVGIYSAKLVTRKIFGQIASGSLYTGKFQLNLADPVKRALRGIPFVGKPTVFKGWFKYLPVGEDSATLYATLSHWDGTQRVTVAEARLTQYDPQQEWLSFEVPFTYTTQSDVDTIAVVFASSAGGEFFKGGEGSTLYVDGVSLGYEPMSIEQSDALVDVVIRSNHMQSNTEMQHVVCYDMSGGVIGIWMHTLDVSFEALPVGVYVVRAVGADGTVYRQLFVKS